MTFTTTCTCAYLHAHPLHYSPYISSSIGKENLLIHVDQDIFVNDFLQSPACKESRVR